MHTTIGTGNRLALLLLGSLMACASKGGEDTVETVPRAQVSATSVETRSVTITRQFPAVSVFLEKSDVTAPLAGFITLCKVKAGDRVSSGATLFKIETKENQAFQDDSLLIANGLGDLGRVSVQAPASGFIALMYHQQGDFVPEGAPLCAFTRNNQVFFKTFIPVSLSQHCRPGNSCRILMPDGQVLAGTIREIMSELDPASQSLQVLVAAAGGHLYPENMNVQVALILDRFPSAAMVPQGVVLSNEELSKFWVMKMIDDSTAVKVPIQPGITQGDSVQILSPVFESGARLLSEGNYGIADTALVTLKP